jgi:hypothetical protein
VFQDGIKNESQDPWQAMARQLKRERMDGQRNKAIFSMFFLEHTEKTTLFIISPHFSLFLVSIV